MPGDPQTTFPRASQIAQMLQSPVAGNPPATSARRAAVLILLFDHSDEAHFVLTRRTDSLAHHPGQISLPGGAMEPQDASLAVAALRETHEEVGIAPDRVSLVGRLPDVHTAVSDFLVTPFIGLHDGTPQMRAEPLEIARIFTPTVRDLVHADARLPADPTIATLRYPLCDEDVWGATARILRAASQRIRGGMGIPVASGA